MLEDIDDTGLDYGTYIKEDLNSIMKNLSEFDKVSRENFFLIGNLKYENKAFLTQFQKMQTLNPKGMVGNSQAKIDSTFNDLIRNYKARGYEIPDFTVKNNIFEIDPLTIEENRLNEFYNHQSREFLEKDMNLKFLENVNNDMVKRLNKNSNNDQNQIFEIDFKRKEKKEIKEMKKVMKSTLEHNNLIKTYFEFKHIKEASPTRVESQDKSNEKEIGILNIILFVFYVCEY